MATQIIPLALSGVIPPMITPLTAEGKVDVAGIERLVDYLIDGGVSGLFLLGSSGGGPWLTLSERTLVIQESVRVAAGRVPVLAGVLEPSTSRTIEAAQMAEDAGADCLVATSPYYFGPGGPDHQVYHFETIARAISLPLMLYNIPPATHNPIELDTVRQLLAVENLIGIKDSAGNWEYFVKLLDLRKTRDFRVFQGAQNLAASSALAGADGLVPGLGNLVPDLFVRLMRSAQAGEREQAFALQERVNELSKLHTHGFWLVCLEYAASLLGFGSGAVCGWPTQNAGADGPSPLSEPARASVREIVRQFATA
jgi:4-hydroxy-tetrahydrodipicolinate synthase